MNYRDIEIKKNVPVDKLFRHTVHYPKYAYIYDIVQTEDGYVLKVKDNDEIIPKVGRFNKHELLMILVVVFMFLMIFTMDISRNVSLAAGFVSVYFMIMFMVEEYKYNKKLYKSIDEKKDDK